jgi:hypothetical protein
MSGMEGQLKTKGERYHTILDSMVEIHGEAMPGLKELAAYLKGDGTEEDKSSRWAAMLLYISTVMLLCPWVETRVKENVERLKEAL